MQRQEQVYLAPNPYKKTYFPSISASISMGERVLPAQLHEASERDDESLKQFAKDYNLAIQGLTIRTHDHADIDTIELKPIADANKPLNEQYFMIKFNGNGMQYEGRQYDFVHDLKQLGMTIIGFNYRGVGLSTQKAESFQNLVTDGIAQVQRLLDRGVNSKKIILDGISLGGAVATMVASHFHKLNVRVYLWNDRSFASVSKAAAEMIAPKNETILGHIFNKLANATSSIAMSVTGWDADVVAAYKSIPAKFKGYMYVAGKADGVIQPEASLNEGVEKNEKRNNAVTGFKFFSPPQYFGRAHNVGRAELISATNPDSTAQDVFEQFAIKVKF